MENNSFKDIWWWVPSAFLFVLISIFIIKSGIPFSNSEVRESYTAYSVAKSGKDTNGVKHPFLFKADGNYLSTLGTYSRVPFAYFFGLSPQLLRIPGIIAGVLSIYLFYLLSIKFLKKRREIFFSVFAFSLSPIILQSVFNVGSIIFFCLILFLWNYFLKLKKTHRLIYAKFLGGALVLVVIAISIFETDYVKFLKRETLFSNLSPSNYSYEIDKRLSFGLQYGSPLITSDFNFNRIGLNKGTFGINALFKSLIAPFNFEKIFSPFQSQTILSKESGGSLPIFYFWEVPLIILGYFVFAKRGRLASYIFYFGLVPAILLKGNFLFFTPFVALTEGLFLSSVIEKYKRYKVFFISSYLLILFLSLYSFIYLVCVKTNDWVSKNDWGQYQIWQLVKHEDMKNKIYVTDRLGEPLFYFLFYKNIDPSYYLQSRVLGSILNNSIQRVEKVGAVTFRSFNFSDEVKKSSEVWVGTGRDFGEKNDDIKIVRTN